MASGARHTEPKAAPLAGDSCRALANGCGCRMQRARFGAAAAAPTTAQHRLLGTPGSCALSAGGSRLASMDSASPGLGGGASRATSRRCSLPSGAADAAQVMGTTKRLSELDRRLDSIDAKPERQGGAPGAKSGGSESRTVKQLLETDEAQHVHSIQVRMSLAADDERQRMLADVGRPHDALERARAERGHPAPSASEHAAAAAEPFQGDASTEKPSAVRRLLRGIPCEPVRIRLCGSASEGPRLQSRRAGCRSRGLGVVRGR